MARIRAVQRLNLLSVREVLAAPDGDTFDGGGLVLRVHDASASWVYRFTSTNGRRREMGLGVAQRGSAKQAGESLTGARERAREAREQLGRGIDPIDERQRLKQAAKATDDSNKTARARDQLTLARAARDYHARAVEPRLSAKHGANWIASLEHHVPAAVWNAPIANITAPELFAALSTIRAVGDPGTRIPETLRRMRQRLDAIFEDAMFHGHCLTNPARAIRRKMQNELPQGEEGALAALPYQQAPAFMAKLREAEGIAARCLEFAMLAAARTNEVLFATWPEFDLEGALWTVPKERMKAKEQHIVPLSSPAIDVLRRQIGLDVTYVFPSPMLHERPMSNMAMLTVLDRMGMRTRTTVHGVCRATFSTWANETGAARPDVIEACLAHREADLVRKAYNRAQFSDERRALLRDWANFLGRPWTSNVVPIRSESN